MGSGNITLFTLLRMSGCMSHLPAITAKDCHDCILDGSLSSPSTPTGRDTEEVPLKLCLQLESTLPNNVQRSQEVTLSWNKTKLPLIPSHSTWFQTFQTPYAHIFNISTYKHHSGSNLIVVSLSSKLALLCLKEKYWLFVSKHLHLLWKGLPIERHWIGP